MSDRNTSIAAAAGETRLPDYSGGSIVNLMASLQLGLGGAEPAYAAAPLLDPGRVSGARQVVLFIVDGLGFDFLRARPQARHLNRHLQGPLTSVFPSTTASAVTTFLTGDAPQQHAVTGWHMYFRELGAVITVLPGRARFGGAPLERGGYDLPALLGHRPFAARIDVDAHMVMPDYIADSPYTRAHAGPATVHGYAGLDALFERCAALLAGDGRSYVHAYWPDLDGAGHMSGMGSEAALARLLALDAAFGRFLEHVDGSDTLVVLTADHGQVDTGPADWLELDACPAAGDHLLVPLCGEPRAAYCYPRDGRAAAFARALDGCFGPRFDLLPSATCLAEGWFGAGAPHPELASRIGDLLWLPHGNAAVKDWLAGESRYRVVGVHGGTSRDEMRVPLVLAHT